MSVELLDDEFFPNSGDFRNRYRVLIVVKKGSRMCPVGGPARQPSRRSAAGFEAGLGKSAGSVPDQCRISAGSVPDPRSIPEPSQNHPRSTPDPPQIHSRSIPDPTQIHPRSTPDPFRSIQIHSGPFRSIQIHSDAFRSFQIHSDPFRSI